MESFHPSPVHWLFVLRASTACIVIQHMVTYRTFAWVAVQWFFFKGQKVKIVPFLHVRAFSQKLVSNFCSILA